MFKMRDSKPEYRDVRIIRPYKWTGMNSQLHPRDRILRCSLAGTYKRLQFRLASHSPRVWGRGRHRWALVRGPSATLPAFLSI